MKIDFADHLSAPFSQPAFGRFSAWSDTDPLSEVLLCRPSHLAPVPCCSKTRESVRNGFCLSTELALRQHDALHQALTSRGVACHFAPTSAALPDLCFTRDVAVTTPWGIVALNPAKPHRRPEIDHMAVVLSRMGGSPISRIRRGRIEGGDVCIARPGLLVLGVSGDRTDEEGAGEFAAPFRRAGWDVIHCPLDPHFLHLDTVFCMLDRQRALACADVLDDDFLDAIAAQGIELIPVSYKEARNLAGNVVSLDGTTILTSAEYPRIAAVLRQEGFEALEIEISQFAACGGGLHCLTMPMARTPRAA